MHIEWIWSKNEQATRQVFKFGLNTYTEYCSVPYIFLIFENFDQIFKPPP